MCSHYIIYQYTIKIIELSEPYGLSVKMKPMDKNVTRLFYVGVLSFMRKLCNCIILDLEAAIKEIRVLKTSIEKEKLQRAQGKLR